MRKTRIGVGLELEVEVCEELLETEEEDEGVNDR
jgi:hypothetical protein